MQLIECNILCSEFFYFPAVLAEHSLLRLEAMYFWCSEDIKLLKEK